MLELEEMLGTPEPKLSVSQNPHFTTEDTWTREGE